MKTAIVVVIGCEINAATKKFPLFCEEELEYALVEMCDFKSSCEEELESKLNNSCVSIFGHGDLIKRLKMELTKWKAICIRFAFFIWKKK